jgi:hypothetical protein
MPLSRLWRDLIGIGLRRRSVQSYVEISLSPSDNLVSLLPRLRDKAAQARVAQMKKAVLVSILVVVVQLAVE